MPKRQGIGKLSYLNPKVDKGNTPQGDKGNTPQGDKGNTPQGGNIQRDECNTRSREGVDDVRQSRRSGNIWKNLVKS